MMWTTEMYDTAISMWQEGHSAKKIGDTIGKTRNAVMSKVAAAGLQRRGGGAPKVRAKPAPRAPKPVVRATPKPKAPEPVLVSSERIELEPELLKETWVPFLECRDSQCKWIVAHMTCCGTSPVSTGRPYCDNHSKLAYRANEPPRNLRPFRRR